jgi:hypothetical protein
MTKSQVMGALIALNAGCRQPAESSLAAECVRAFEHRLALEVAEFAAPEIQREQRRILEGARGAALERCMAARDIDAAHCQARAATLRAVADCGAQP